MADRSGYIGRAPGDSSIVISRQTFNPIGVQTNFTFSSGYIPGYLDVYLNGVRLIEANDYTATDTSVVGLTSAAQNGDVLEMVAYKAFNIAVVSEALSDFTVGNDLNVSGNVTVTGDVSGRNFTGVAATFTGNVTVGGVLTYEDVTNVDSVGVITARSGVHILNGDIGVGTDNTSLGKAVFFGSGDGNDQGPILSLVRHSNTPATNDRLGALNFYGKDSDDNTVYYKSVYTRIVNPTSGSATGQLCIGTNHTTAGRQVIIDADGSVGIGTDNITEKLHVVGDARVTGILTVGTSSVTINGNTGKIAGVSDTQLASISSSISDTAVDAVDVFVYDTSKDSDGGAWRKRTQNTSWYNETLNTATRGSRKEFPAVAVIVTTSDGTLDSSAQVRIYDGDDPDLPMWMVFQADGGVGSGSTRYAIPGVNDLKASKMLNGNLCVVVDDIGTGGRSGLEIINFLSETMEHLSSSLTHGNVREFIATRNDLLPFRDTDNRRQIVNNNVNDVAMTVLPNAPIDDTTGLPIPTIAIATDGGASLIKDNGNVYDDTDASALGSIDFNDEYRLISTRKSTGSAAARFFVSQPVNSVSSDSAWLYDYYTGNFATGHPRLRLDDTGAGVVSALQGDTCARGSNIGFTLWNVNNGDELSTGGNFTNSLLCGISTSYNTGYMHGDIKGAFLSDTDATNQTGGTVPDRSVNNNSVNVTGTITRTAVATGAELVAYGPFSSSNYMDNTSFSVDFGNPPTISIMFWQKITDITDYSYAMSLSAGTNNKGGISNGASSTGYPGQAYFNMGSQTLYTGSRVDDGNWHCLVGTIEGTVKNFYLDGNLASSATINNHDMSGITRINAGSYGTTHAYPHLGSLALLRVSKSVPSPEQIKKMYEDEKVLFQENAKATLYGSSDAVTALAYDDTTELLHVGTSAGRSEFQGLRRINNTTTAVTTAISASNELVAEQ